MPRPLIQRSTEELSALFDEWRNDRAKLRGLLEELQHRDRPRAKKLREQVEQMLSRDHAQHGDNRHDSKQEVLPLSEGSATAPTEAKATQRQEPPAPQPKATA